MLEIKIDITPFGEDKNKRELGLLKIWDDRTGSPDTGNYEWYYKGENYVQAGRLKKFNQSNGMITLLQKVLNQMQKERRTWELENS